jgi:hypothetical protein
MLDAQEREDAEDGFPGKGKVFGVCQDKLLSDCVTQNLFPLGM